MADLTPSLPSAAPVLSPRALPWRDLLIALVFLAGGLAFPIFRVLGISDGARFEPGLSVWKPTGILLTPLDARTDGIRARDVLVAVDGRPVLEWVQSLFSRAALRPKWHMGEAVEYTVIRDGKPRAVSIRAGPYPWKTAVARNWSTLLFVIVTQGVGTLVFFKKPGDPAARGLFLWGWSLSHTYVWATGLQATDLVNGAGFWLYQLTAKPLWLAFCGASVYMALVFPRPTALVARNRRLPALAFAAPFILWMGYVLLARSTAVNILDWMGHWQAGEYLAGIAFNGMTIAIVMRGYFTSLAAPERQKVRWVVFVSAVCVSIGIVVWMIPAFLLGRTLVSASAFGLILLPIPLSLAISILRRRLFDIDLIIRRTLIYGILTAALALLYFGLVVGLQNLLAAFTNQQSPVAIVVSTLAIAALFSPLRRWVQNVIDRRFFRKKYDAAKTLAEFGATARDEVELEKLTGRLVAVVEETMQPEGLSLWLKPPVTAPVTLSSRPITTMEEK